MKGQISLRHPVGSPLSQDNSSILISHLLWQSLGTLTAPCSAIQLYNGSSKAVQVSDGAIAVHGITFSAVPDAGKISFTFGLHGTTGDLNFGDGAVAFQALLDTLFGAGKTVVTGTFTAGFVVYFNSFPGPMALPTVAASTLTNTGVAVVTTIAATVVGVVQTFLYAIAATGISSLIATELKNGGKLFAKAVGAADATTGFITASFFG